MSSPVIIHIPHASASIPECEKKKLALAAEDLQRELLRMTDWYTDELFDAGAGASRLKFPVSRLVCDPERFSDKTNEPMEAKGMGAVYTKTSDGRPLRSSLDDEERKRLLELYHAPHHKRLEQLVQEALATSGHGLIIDAHSFPSSPLRCDLDQAPLRPDICVGTDQFHTPEWLQQTAVAAFTDLGWSVELNRPYDGAIVPGRFYKEDARVHSIMVEINRALYMDEDNGEPSAEFGEVRRKVQSALDAIIASLR